MFRLKLLGLLALVISLTMALVYFMLPVPLQKATETATQRELHVAARTLEQSQRLDEFSLQAKAEEIAAFQSLKNAITANYDDNAEYKRHLKVHEVGILRWNSVFKNRSSEFAEQDPLSLSLQQRPPHQLDLFFITDENGIGLAADGQGRYEWYGVNVAEKHPSILKVSDGQARQETWQWAWNPSDNTSLFRVGIAPIMDLQDRDKLIGVVVVGTLIDASTAKRAAKTVQDLDVAYFSGAKIYGSTLSPAEESTLASQLFSSPDVLKDSPKTVPVTLSSRPFQAAVRYTRTQDPSKAKSSGVIVLADSSLRAAPVQKLKTFILVLGAVLLVLVLLIVGVAVSAFIRPFVRIDQGIQEVITGNTAHVFKTPPSNALAASLAHSLNNMSAYLQGKPLPDEDPDEEDPWKNFLVEEVSQTSIMRAVQGKPIIQGVDLDKAKTPEEEPLDTHIQRVYNEYITAKKNLGEDTSDLTLEGFSQRMKNNIEQLKEQHNARDIRFNVTVREGKVVLKPQPIGVSKT